MAGRTILGPKGLLNVGQKEPRKARVVAFSESARPPDEKLPQDFRRKLKSQSTLPDQAKPRVKFTGERAPAGPRQTGFDLRKKFADKVMSDFRRGKLIDKKGRPITNINDAFRMIEERFRRSK